MQKIPDTFCPAKWDELIINFSYNLVNSCCKATPLHFVDDYKSIIKAQQDNLLNGVKDPTCEYCWKTENDGNISRRQDRYLKYFNQENIEFYKTGQSTIKYLEINLGNSCNLQCIYCNPKFSSKWEDDVRFKKYPIITDRFNYELVKKNKKILDQNINFLSNVHGVKTVNIIGGEPLTNNRFFDILEHVTVDTISLSTNLSVSRYRIDKLLESTKKYKKVLIACSIDSTNELTQFLRHGIDIDLFYDNLRYLASLKKENIEITIQSLMTNISVLDIKKTSNLFIDFINENNNINWAMSYCKNPRIFGFESLPDILRADLIDNFKQILNNKKIFGADTIISALREINFNKGIFREFEHFIKEWENRKQVKLPTDIKEKLYAETK